ncbi:MAG: HAD family hydrolase [Desulfohalobiaceae bacterium]
MSQEMNTQGSYGAAVFLDRDGTIIEDRGDLSDPGEVVWYEDTIPSLLRLSERFALFMVTNQSGVAKGTISMDDADRVNVYVASVLEEHGVSLAAISICPHERGSGCRCRKPSPYFLKKAEQDFRIDLGRSFVVGDHPHDVELADNAGATGIYVLSGHGRKHRDGIPEDAVVAEGIGEAAEEILARGRRAGDGADQGRGGQVY